MKIKRLNKRRLKPKKESFKTVIHTANIKIRLSAFLADIKLEVKKRKELGREMAPSALSRKS